MKCQDVKATMFCSNDFFSFWYFAASWKRSDGSVSISLCTQTNTHQNVAWNPHLPFCCLFWPYFYIHHFRVSSKLLLPRGSQLYSTPWGYNCFDKNLVYKNWRWWDVWEQILFYVQDCTTRYLGVQYNFKLRLSRKARGYGRTKTKRGGSRDCIT